MRPGYPVRLEKAQPCDLARRLPYTRKGRENASVRNRGRRQRSSLTPAWNGLDTVKVCQGKFDQRQGK